MAVWDRLVPFEYYLSTLPTKQKSATNVRIDNWHLVHTVRGTNLGFSVFCSNKKIRDGAVPECSGDDQIDIQRGNQSVSLFSRPHIRSIKYLKVIAITANTLNFALMAK